MVASVCPGREVLPMVCVSLIVSVFLAVCAPQDVPKAEDLLRWFPEGTYDAVSHIDIEKFRALKAGELVGVRLSPAEMAEGSGDSLPLSFFKKYKSITLAHLVKYELAEDETLGETGKEEEGRRERLSPIEISFEDADGNRVFRRFSESGTDLIVFRFDDLRGLIKAAIKSGEISATDILLFEVRVYSFTGRDGVETYLYPADFEELLVAYSLHDLKSMVEAGYGVSPAMIENPDFAEFEDVFPSLGCIWINRDSALRFRLQYRAADKLGAPETLLNVYKKKLDAVASMDILSWDFGDHMIELWIRVYEDEDAAEERYGEETANFVKAHTPRAGATPQAIDYFNDVRRKTSLRLEGREVIIETIKDAELLEKEAKLRRSQSGETKKKQ